MNGKPGRPPNLNNPDQYAYNAAYYQTHKQTMDANKVRRRTEIVEWWRQYRATLRCIYCGEDHPACIDLHHREPNSKTMHVSKMVYRAWAIERIKEEIAKCDPICANCHRKMHWDDKDLKRNNEAKRRVALAALMRS